MLVNQIKKTLLFITWSVGLLLSVQVFAGSSISTGLWSNKALSGYDAVAYFTQNKAVKGSDQYQLEYKGAEWHFSSAENLALFKANPEKYAPQYGGYCAWAVAHGKTAKSDPEQWTIVNGKLYLNYDANIKQKWLKDKNKFIQQADKNWPAVIK